MDGFTWLPDAAWRGALLLGVTFVVARLLKSQPAAVRHVLWTGALAGVMAMPILAVIAPAVPVTVPQRVLQTSAPATPANSLGRPDVARQSEGKNVGVENTTPSISAVDTQFNSAVQAIPTPSHPLYTRRPPR